MAKVKVINTNLDQNLNGTYFNDFPSRTIFTFGSFNVTSNFDNKVTIDYSNTLSSFVRAVTLETMGATTTQSQILHDYTTNAVLNLDKSDLNTFVRFGSAYEFLRISIQNIILAYPGSLFSDSQKVLGGNDTFSGYTYDVVKDVATFYVPVDGNGSSITNKFGLVYNNGNTNNPDNNPLKNLNTSYNDYIIWTYLKPNNIYPVIGFTGNTINSSDFLTRNYIKIQVTGDPFSTYTATTNHTGSIDFHIKPNNMVFEEFRALLNDYEKYIVSERDGTNGFQFVLKNPTLLDDGTIVYSDSIVLWTTGDKYNVDIDTPSYQKFLQIVLTIGAKYDTIKTDLIARFLTPASLKTYDYTDNGKITKLLRVYGREFDQIREFIDSLVYINKVTYDKLNNIPDQIISNMARTFGWNYFSLVNEAELVQSFLTVDDNERNLNENLLPSEIDIELWRRILNNTSYFWKSKGTRETIKSMFLLIGIPDPFINITEYVYTVDGVINPNTVKVAQQDFPNSSLPYDNSGYPKVPIESNTFYFQISGDTDGGQAYINNFRKAGFNLSAIVDNKKSWIQTGATTRVHYSTPHYYQGDSKLVINTKEVDVALDTARGIEYDVYDYIKYTDFPANSSGYTSPYSYVNISLNYTGTQNIFQLPIPYDKTQGDLEVHYNGILLNAPKTGSTGVELTRADYSISGNQFTLLNSNYATNSGNRRDVIQATFIYSGGTSPVTGITVQYIVTRIKPQFPYTTIPLPSYPRGDIQVTINGIALTKGTNQFNADYILDPTNTTGSSQIILQNTDVISYLSTNPEVQVAYVEVHGSNNINARSEIVRIDSFNTSKIYYNNSANKYVYKLNYKANNASDIKFLVDGIALEPIRDYNINVMNPYEVFLPSGLKYGMVLSVYYIVGVNSAFTSVISDSFGIGDISKLSFLEFIEMIQRKMVNARNRKTISDFKGGWYPTLLKIYEMYLKRGTLPTGNTLHSNGYTFENLYPFLSKYNAFFQRFVDQLLSATIILKKGGLLVRNTVFTKQKFVYKRGVNIGGISYPTPPLPYYQGNAFPIGAGNLSDRSIVQYLGDDGSMFSIIQENEPDPNELYVETRTGVAGTGSLLNIGGKRVNGYNTLTQYGIQYRKRSTSVWINKLINGNLPNSSGYVLNISGLLENTTYEYRAIVISNNLTAIGNVLALKTSGTVIPPAPSGLTKMLTSTSPTEIIGTGGYAIQSYDSVQWYGMQYRCIGTTDINVSPSSYSSVPSTGAICNITVCGQAWNTYTTSGNTAWITPAAPSAPSSTGTTNSLTIAANIGAARSGIVQYTPLIGTPHNVTISQLVGTPPSKPVQISECSGYPTYPDYPTCLNGSDCGILQATGMSAGESFYVTFAYSMTKPATASSCILCTEVKCGSTVIYSCVLQSKKACNCSGTFGSRLITYDDSINQCWKVMVCASADDVNAYNSYSSVSISNVVNNVGTFNLSPNNILSVSTYSNY